MQINNDGVVDYPNAYVMDSNGEPVVDGDIETALPVYKRVKDVDDVDIKYGRVSALWMPNDTFNLQLSYQKQKDEIGGRRQVTSGNNLVTGAPYGDYEFGAIQLEPADRDIDVTALEMELSFGFATTDIQHLVLRPHRVRNQRQLRRVCAQRLVCVLRQFAETDSAGRAFLR